MNYFHGALAGLIIGSAAAASDGYWQQDVHYTMQVRLNVDDHQVTGSSHIIYTNNSPDTLRQFYLILYPNAFQVGSVKYRESLEIYSTGGISADNPSSLEIAKLKLTAASGAVTTDFEVDDTSLEIELPEPLAPGTQLTLELEWTHTVRKHIGRAGRRDGQYDLAQWYPKVVVYDENGWNNETFHRIGEFYGEFSTFDVTIDVPYRYVVAATGTVTAGNPGWEAVRVDTSRDFTAWAGAYKIRRDSLLADREDERRIVSFQAEQVHDFAWITSPDFVYEHGQWNGIDVHVIYNLKVGTKWTKKVASRSERALEWLHTRFGPYPYPQVSVTHGLLGGGMEYPMLVMNARESEGLIVHEIGHIWFYGILGNNEMEEAWLDEGFTTFQTRWYLTSRYGPLGREIHYPDSSRWQGYRRQTPSLAKSQWRVAAFQTSGHNEPIATAAYRSGGGLAYYVNAYPKPSLMLESLQYIMGEAAFDRGMQNYYRAWALKHPNEDRFRREMEAATGRELDWFFDQWLHTSGYLDYALKKWRQQPGEDGGYEVDVTIERRGSWEAPVVVEAITVDGQQVRGVWEDFRNKRTGTLTLRAPSKVRELILDPDDKLMDTDRRNNGSSRLPTTIAFKPFLADYHPRDRYTLAYLPVVRYNFTDQLTPAIKLERRYGPGNGNDYSTSALELGVGLGSGRADWAFQHDAPLNLHDRRSSYRLAAFSRDGINGASLDLERFWSRAQQIRPIYTARFSLATVDARDTTYAPGLFDEGRLTSATTMLRVERQTMNWRYKYEMTAAAGAATLGDFDFSRFIFELRANRDVPPWVLNLRVLAGGIWSAGPIPNQERFTVAAAGSMDTYNRSYLSAEGALFGFGGDLQGRHHLPGDANLRGYYDLGYFGAERLVTTTLELSRAVTVGMLGRVGGRFFADGGWLWGDRFSRQDDDPGFDGDLLFDLGFGLEWSHRLFGQSLYLRVDFPFLRLADSSIASPDIGNGIDVDFGRWVFSFQRGL